MEINKAFRCTHPGCEKAFWFKAALARHKKTHQEPDPLEPAVTWGCSECTKLFVKLESLRRHYRTTHGNVFVYPCNHPGCNQMFQRKDNLKRHAASHSDIKKTCEICGRAFSRQDALTRHKTIHTRQAQTNKMDRGDSESPTEEHISNNTDNLPVQERFVITKCEP